jgi:hypothetical protein
MDQVRLFGFYFIISNGAWIKNILYITNLKKTDRPTVNKKCGPIILQSLTSIFQRLNGGAIETPVLMRFQKIYNPPKLAINESVGLKQTQASTTPRKSV